MISPYTPRIVSCNLHAAPWDEFLGIDYGQSIRNNIDAIVNQVQQTSKVDNLLFWQTEHIDFHKTGLDLLRPALEKSGYNIISVLDHSYISQQNSLAKIGKTHFLPIVLASTYYQMEVKNTSIFNQAWNPLADKFLFLTGKPMKANRTRLLWLLSRSGLLDRAIWSYFMTPGMMKASKRFIPEITEQEFETFVTQHQQNPDKVDIVYSSPQTCHYDGYVYDIELYKKSRFRLIAETLCDTMPYLTEKTWIPVINHVPFLMAASPGTLKYMKSLGFYTFEEYALEPYDHIVDNDKRFLSIIKTAKHWMQFGLPKQVSQEVQHNYQLFREIGKKYFLDLENIFKELGESQVELDKLIPLDNMVTYASWPSWYQRVRDPSWPDCNKEDDFYLLPDWIQKECVEVFGYQPKEKI